MIGLWIGLTARILLAAMEFAGFQIGQVSGLANAFGPSLGSFEGATLVASLLCDRGDHADLCHRHPPFDHRSALVQLHGVSIRAGHLGGSCEPNRAGRATFNLYRDGNRCARFSS